MAKAALYTQSGERQGEQELTDAVFGVHIKREVVHQVYTALRDRVREPWAHTKNKGEVRGGGRKPWQQKGTGRARHGSIRSPLWKGGGVTFGPRNVRNYFVKINKKMNRLAVKMCLSSKVADEKFFVVQGFSETGKTKGFAELRAALPGAGKSTLILSASGNGATVRAAGNIPDVRVVRAADVNVVDLLHHQFVLATPEALKVLETRLS